MDLDQIRTLIEIIEDSDVREINLEEEGLKVNIKRGYQVSDVNNGPLQTKEVVQEAPIEKQQETPLNKGEEVLAPMVGTFYRAPAPDAEPFVKVGDTISKGDTLCIIEAMKLMNEIEVETEGKIIDILVEDGQAVEYGQALFLIETN